MLTQYYRGIYNQIQSELEFINELFVHNGLKGEGNESIISELLKKFIPKKYGIGTGIVVDKDGTSSRQCDIIIYDIQSYPEIFTLSNVHIYPVDLVYAVIEVKTTLDKKQSMLALENIKSVRSLNYIKDSFRSKINEPFDVKNPNSIIAKNKNTTPPIGLVLAYQSTTKNFETLSKWFKSDDTVNTLPSHIYCLDHGFTLTKITDDPKPILCPLIENEEYFTKKDAKNTITKNKKEWGERSGVWYPISKFKNEEMLIDQSKILLNFIFLLVQQLDNKEISPNINLRNEYFDKELKTFFSMEDGQITLIDDI